MDDDLDVTHDSGAGGDIVGRHRHVVLAGAVREPAVVAGGEREHLRAIRADPDRHAALGERVEPDTVDLLAVEPATQGREPIGEQLDAAAA